MKSEERLPLLPSCFSVSVPACDLRNGSHTKTHLRCETFSRGNKISVVLAMIGWIRWEWTRVYLDCCLTGSGWDSKSPVNSWSCAVRPGTASSAREYHASWVSCWHSLLSVAILTVNVWHVFILFCNFSLDKYNVVRNTLSSFALKIANCDWWIWRHCVCDWWIWGHCV